MLRTRVCVALAVPILAVGVVGCDNAATFFEQQLRVRDVTVIGATPAVPDGAGGWRAACGGEAAAADALLLSVVVASHQRQDGDPDEAVGPGDRIRHWDVLPVAGIKAGPRTIDMSQALDVAADCIGDASLPDCAQPDPVLSKAGVDWRSSGVTRGEGSDIVMVLDYSGSTSGLVDASGREHSPAGLADYISESFADLASDFSGLRRASAGLYLGRLGPNDRITVLAFGEGLTHGLLVPCSLSTGADPFVDLQTCFAAGREVWEAEAGLGQLVSEKAPGRANLWEAVTMAGDMLAGLDDLSPSAHVVVVSDGPDTCEGTGVCGDDASLEGALASLDAANARLHVIQMESQGYPGRDAAQMAATCDTGGHYRFINSNHLSSTGASALREALDAAMLELRLALRGHWQIALEAPGLSGLPIDAPAWALDGALTVSAASGLVDTDWVLPFSWGERAPEAWDGRPSWLSSW